MWKGVVQHKFALNSTKPRPRSSSVSDFLLSVIPQRAVISLRLDPSWSFDVRPGSNITCGWNFSHRLHIVRSRFFQSVYEIQPHFIWKKICFASIVYEKLAREFVFSFRNFRDFQLLERYNWLFGMTQCVCWWIHRHVKFKARAFSRKSLRWPSTNSSRWSRRGNIVWLLWPLNDLERL